MSQITLNRECWCCNTTKFCVTVTYEQIEMEVGSLFALSGKRLPDCIGFEKNQRGFDDLQNCGGGFTAYTAGKVYHVRVVLIEIKRC